MFHNMTQKKRDCTVAVPLLKALALPIILNKQHRSPRRYVRTRTPMLYSRCTDIDIHIPRTSKCCNVLEWFFEFARFWEAKHKALMTPLLCLQSRGAAVQYCSTLFRVVQYCPFAPSLRCKGTIKFADVQENGDFFSRFAGDRTFMRAMGYWVKGASRYWSYSKSCWITN